MKPWLRQARGAPRSIWAGAFTPEMGEVSPEKDRMGPEKDRKPPCAAETDAPLLFLGLRDALSPAGKENLEAPPPRRAPPSTEAHPAGGSLQAF